MQNLNIQLFNFFNAGANLHGVALALAIALAKYVVFLIPLWIIVLWLYGARTYRGTLVFSVFAAAFALLISYLIGGIWYQPRPFMLDLGHMYLPHAPDSTFPSDHVTFMWAVGLSFLIEPGLRRPGTFILILAVLVGWARVFLGIHFPFDILGAILLATLTVLILSPFKPWINRKIVPSIEAFYRKVFAKAIAKGIVRA